MVLAGCILSYIEKDKRALITAPTNNAVEQTLYGVLAVLEEAGIALDCVLRIGTPSHTVLFSVVDTTNKWNT